MYKRILVPLDGSILAETILPHVEQLAQCFDATVILLHVLEPVAVATVLADPQMGTFVDAAEQRQEFQARRYIDQTCQSLHSKNIDIRVRLNRGTVVSTILEVAEEENADLIAMASHGRTGLSQMLYGSNANGVLHQSSRPLLLVHPEGYR